MGASTPHFALQLRNRIRKLIAGLPEGDPARRLGEQEIARLERLGVQRRDARRGLPGRPAARCRRWAPSRLTSTRLRSEQLAVPLAPRGWARIWVSAVAPDVVSRTAGDVGPYSGTSMPARKGPATRWRETSRPEARPPLRTVGDNVNRSSAGHTRQAAINREPRTPREGTATGACKLTPEAGGRPATRGGPAASAEDGGDRGGRRAECGGPSCCEPASICATSTARMTCRAASACGPRPAWARMATRRTARRSRGTRT